VLSLNDTLPAVLPEDVVARFPDSGRITVRMLLNHSSGIPEWLTPAAVEQIGADPAKVWEVDEFLDLAAAQPPSFAPGAGYHYSNTDYNLLGLVIEEATGRSWREEVTERVIEPLQLENTLLPGRATCRYQGIARLRLSPARVGITSVDHDGRSGGRRRP
jgi:D-alanyl-D-alanine carboxypeptidase